MIEASAGDCTQGRHSWGPETKTWTGTRYPMYPKYNQYCRKCERVRVIEYTQRGNHVAGYFTTQKGT